MKRESGCGSRKFSGFMREKGWVVNWLHGQEGFWGGVGGGGGAGGGWGVEVSG